MIRISKPRLAAFLVVVSCLLAAAGAIAEWERLLGGHARLLGLEPLLDAGDEANLWGAHHAVASTGFLALHVGEELGESLGATLAVVALVAELGARGGVRLAIE